MEIRNLKDGQTAYTARLQTWTATDVGRRLWSRDHTLWSPEPAPELTDRLGWLELPTEMPAQLADLTAFAREVRDEGTAAVVLLGMGGSSLAPEVFQASFGNAAGYPALYVLDSTHPGAVRTLTNHLDLNRTLFLVSSKSGTTTETLSLFAHFRQALAGRAEAGRRFVAITDPATPLADLARERGFRRVFTAPPDVGGRYAALTPFGLVPAALIGLDVHLIVDRARAMARDCGPDVPADRNPGLQLGAALGEWAGRGRDKVTFLLSPGIAAWGNWVEQLIAESTGKGGRGILPVTGEPLLPASAYGLDRVFAYLRLAGGQNDELDRLVAGLAAAGHPLVQISLTQKADLGREFFRWEVATAAAGMVLGLNPFNQPDVQLAKDMTRKLLSGGNVAASGGAADGAAGGDADGTADGDAAVGARDTAAVQTFLAQARANDYIGIQAYLEPASETTTALQKLRRALSEHTGLATTLGYGPRFLHSTGQWHKGGPNSGLFLQLTDDPAADVPVPGQSYSFGTLIAAQSLGDLQALRQRGRRVLRVHLERDVAGGLLQLTAGVRRIHGRDG